MDTVYVSEYKSLVDQIRYMPWRTLTMCDMTAVIWAVHYVSIQYRESVGIGRSLYPADMLLARLETEKCGISDRSPWIGITSPGEQFDHHEHLSRIMKLAPLKPDQQAWLCVLGEDYLRRMRLLDPVTRILGAISFEVDGLEQIYRAMLEFPEWEIPVLRAFEAYLLEQLRFETDPGQDELEYSRLTPDDTVLPVWKAFRDLLAACVPQLAR